MFLWAVGEATVWPIIPDFLLTPMAAVARRRFYLPLVASVAGMALGGCATFLISYRTPERATRLLMHLPDVRERRMDHVRARLDRQGARAFVLQPWSGIPSKVWAVAGGSMRMNLSVAIPVFIAARAFRMALFAAGAGLLTDRFSRFVREYFLLLAPLYVIAFLYGWWKVVTRKR